MILHNNIKDIIGSSMVIFSVNLCQHDDIIKARQTMRQALCWLQARGTASSGERYNLCQAHPGALTANPNILCHL